MLRVFPMPLLFASFVKSFSMRSSLHKLNVCGLSSLVLGLGSTPVTNMPFKLSDG